MLRNSLAHVATSGEVATMWGVSTQAVSKAIKRGVLYGERAGVVWLVCIFDAREYFGRPPELVIDRLEKYKDLLDYLE